MTKMEEESNVRVAVRIRPQLPKEVIDMCHVCTRVTPGEPQVLLGTDKAFTFDYVFDTQTKQQFIYDTCVRKLIDGCFDGFNATVLAYGQTGSGKTFTMGTGFEVSSVTKDHWESKGIIPRAVEHLYSEISIRQNAAREKGEPVPEFKITSQFLELYNEDIIDLLAEDRTKQMIKIHEDVNGQIYTVGVMTKPVSSVEETLQCLRSGALSRTTASTQMNAQSSRSHAIFTLNIMQTRVTRINNENEDPNCEELTMVNGDEGIGNQELEQLRAKFHFVDLAGSERLKRTGATGERAREGIAINSGLLSLGNVISALGDKSRKASHIPYRDSKLTRLLQDSLGGNSVTLMIACVSPSDRDFMETLNTLRYANRAKNIKNKVFANQDKSSQIITALRREIQELQIELQEYKQGKRIVEADGTEKVNDMYYENTMLQSENNNLKTRVKALQETNELLTTRNTQLLAERETAKWIRSSENGGDEENHADIETIVHTYIKEIEDLRVKLMEQEQTCAQLKRQQQRQSMNRLTVSPSIASHYEGGFETEASLNDIIEEAKKDIARQRRIKRQLDKTFKDTSKSDTNGNEIDQNDVQNGEVNDENEEVDDEEDSTEDSEIEDLSGIINSEELASLTEQIDQKEKLITQLEKSQRQMNLLKQQYEEKLQVLQNKIVSTEQERDNVLAKLNAVGNKAQEEKVKKVKEEYEKKLNAMQLTMKQLQAARKQHAQSIKTQAVFEHQLRTVRNELEEMKKHKVRLVAKLKEEAQRHRENEIKINKKMAQMAKQDRQKDLKIKGLENEKNRFQNLLKRKDEEVNALKNQKRFQMSDKVAGRAIASRQPNPNRRINTIIASPVSAKNKWQKLEMNINQMVLNKHTISIQEKQLDRHIQNRQQLSKSLEKTMKRYNEAVKSPNQNHVQIESLLEEIEAIESNLTYLNETINDIQSTIVQLSDMDNNDLVNLLAGASPTELKYLFNKTYSLAVTQACLASQKEEERNEFEMQLKNLTDNSLIQEQLLNHVLDTTFMVAREDQDQFDDNFDDKIHRPNQYPVVATATATTTTTTNEYNIGYEPLDKSSPEYSRLKKEKARRLTKTPQELLFDTSTMEKSKLQEEEMPLTMTQSMIAYATPAITSSSTINEIQRIPSAPSLKESHSFSIAPAKTDLTFHTPAFKRKTYDRLPIIEQPNVARSTQSLRSRNSSINSSGNSIANSMINNNSKHAPDINDSTPPNTPPIARRNIREDNVFNRLTVTNNQTNNDRAGHINAFNGRSVQNAPLVCTHVAEGHTRAVLSVVGTNDVLFSGSKDCSVKIWDLHTGHEIQSLTDHPDSVQVVRYNEYCRLAFSVSRSYIKVWDPRDNPARCVKTLNSSGLVSQGYITANPIRGMELAPGECPILDIQLSTYGTTLYSTCSRIVRVWDLRMYHCIGKLNTGHQSGIICMAVEEAGVDNNIVVTGSKDHYIKVFEMMEGVGGIHNPKATLKPPHYDGIESLVIHSDYLFSGSRDACIKKWDLSNQRMVQSLNNCHKDWIQALSVMPNSNTLISGCRSGQLKLWSTDTCQLMGDIKAHSSAIHSIDTNSSLVFTGSGDNTISIWRWNQRSNGSDPSSDVCFDGTETD